MISDVSNTIWRFYPHRTRYDGEGWVSLPIVLSLFSKKKKKNNVNNHRERGVQSPRSRLRTQLRLVGPSRGGGDCSRARVPGGEALVWGEGCPEGGCSRPWRGRGIKLGRPLGGGERG